MLTSIRIALRLAALATALFSLSLTACRPNLANLTQDSSVKEQSTKVPQCTSNDGSGFGAIFECATGYCAKQKSDFTEECSIDEKNACVAAKLSSKERGVTIDKDQSVYEVGSGMFYNGCTSNDGKGFGSPWPCGNGQCANATDGKGATQFCRVSGGSLVEKDALKQKLTVLVYNEKDCPNPNANAPAKVAEKTPTTPVVLPGNDAFEDPTQVNTDAALGLMTFWDDKAGAGSSAVISVMKVSTWYPVRLLTPALSGNLTKLKAGYRLLIEFKDGSTATSDKAEKYDDLNVTFPNKVVSQIKVEPTN